MKRDEQSKSKQTLVVHDGHDERHHGAVTFPIYQNSLFTFSSVAEYEQATADHVNRHLYTRGNNPTVNELEKKLAQLEGAEKARCFASGMAAISAAILSAVQSGDHILCIDQAYGPARSFMSTYLRKFGIETTFVDGTSLESIRTAIRPNTSLLYLESPSSMFFQLQDITECARIAHEAGVLVLIDNTWSTPICQNPLQLGADLVIHSISKYISGHSDALGGFIAGRAELMDRIFHNEFSLIGGIMTAQTAALVMRGLRTLPVRLKQQQESGLAIARFLERLPFIRRVNHPGLPSHPQHELARKQMSGYSSLLSFEADLAPEQMKEWASHLALFRIGVSWGGYESLVLVQAMAPKEGSSYVRLYIGLEEPDDITADMTAAFEAIGAYDDKG
ncbi:trans-sulfuration enzyme family protein [Paenibacillus spongiae]|uniref:Aminotransferase class I/II-fold pyridoxal phosphate-dependent enzyme n=1 Tax=Paenibacillus spongiae TaxID=2909671 RepID=A0ABY5SG76_9BACL|nr:aminotransferase class I/II-fold pyridoxal phosphate-dependent enzyme [Paenibacillus spongiae]UVI32654.1 aminotransferase class I/II-fold pyridoxal phosphate-dependent enzyme [Paenibacillus spongiae]